MNRYKANKLFSESPSAYQLRIADEVCEGVRDGGELLSGSGLTSILPRTFSNLKKVVEMAQISGRLVEALDQIEKRVELLRQEAMALEQEKGCLLEMIETIQNNKDLALVTEGEREEIYVNAQRLMGRCISVEVQVSTPRNSLQEAALMQVDQFIEELLCRLRTDLAGSKVACQAFLNACLPDANGPINQRFQSAIIECAAEDQKKIRKRLESLLRTIEHSEKNVIKNL